MIEFIHTEQTLYTLDSSLDQNFTEVLVYSWLVQLNLRFAYVPPQIRVLELAPSDSAHHLPLCQNTPLMLHASALESTTSSLIPET